MRTARQEISWSAAQVSIKFTLALRARGTIVLMSKFTVTEEWAILWAQCLFSNLDYGFYSGARDDFYGEEDRFEKYNGDQEFEEMKSLELKFPLLRELYEDFGEAFDFGRNELTNNKWKQWFATHKNLFLAEVSEPKDLNEYVKTSGYVLLDVPICKSLEETLANVKNYLENNVYNSDDQMRVEPKYRLLIKQGKTMLSYNAARRAALVGTDNDLHNMNFSGKAHSVEEAILLFLRKNFDLLDLSWSKAEVDELMNKRIPIARKESIRAAVGLWRDQFRCLSANTIRGRFPDTTVFDSRSWDLFQGVAVTPKKI